MTASELPIELLAGAGTVIAAIVAARLAHTLGLPALLVFLGLGLALGESGAGIQFSDARVAEVLVSAGTQVETGDLLIRLEDAP